MTSHHTSTRPERTRTRSGAERSTRPLTVPDADAPSSDALAHLSGIPDDAGRIPAFVVAPWRLFLGITFIYAALQKFTDPQFFSPTAPGFIGRQMSGYVHSGSPLSPLLTHLAIPHAAQFGALIAVCELWFGLSALLGLLTRLGALGGLAISLTLYLTATWSVHPYFLGSDLPYACGWLTVLLAGPGPYSLDGYFFGLRRSRQTGVGDTLAAGRGRLPTAARQIFDDPVSRASLMRALGSAAAVLVGGGIVGGVAKLRTPNKSFAGASTSLEQGAASGGTTAAAPTAATSGGAAAAPPGYRLLGNVKVLPVNSAGQYTDPISGDPALLVHLPGGRFVAYDAVCTHAGCTVEYDPTQHQLVCPCHGAAFDPTQGAQVLAGPAPQPLATLQVTIDATGNAYAKA